MAFIRDNQVQGRYFDLIGDTPIMIMGDLNLVGYAEQLHTLLTGTIVNLDPYSPSFKPDWDGSDFTSLLPRHTDSGMYFTWYSETESFSPGILDYIIYSDSVLEPGNSFILFTSGMTADSLAKYGLEARDAVIASDHLPVVGDFSLSGSGNVTVAREPVPAASFDLEQNYPNPFNASTRIRFYLHGKDDVRLAVYDLKGREIGVLAQGHYSAGSHEMNFNTDELPSGLYFYRLESCEGVIVRKMCILK